MSALRQQGINALKTGSKSQARQLLRMAVDENPQDAQAWLWLSGAVETDQERLDCLKTVLRLDPNNTVAAKGIAKLVTSGNLGIQGEPLDSPSSPTASVPAQRANDSEKLQGSQDRKPRVLFETRPSIIPFVLASVLSILFIGLIGGVFLGWIGDQPLRTVFWMILILMGLAALARMFGLLIGSLFVRYTLTTQFLIVQGGVFSRSKKTIPISKIQDVSAEQHFLFRLFGIGSVIVESAGEWGQTKLRLIAHCEKRSDQILKEIQKYH